MVVDSYPSDNKRQGSVGASRRGFTKIELKSVPARQLLSQHGDYFLGGNNVSNFVEHHGRSCGFNGGGVKLGTNCRY